MLEHKCLATATSRDEWLWHYKLGYLNFRDISHMHKQNMALRFPIIHIRNEVCEECVQSKQHKNKFSKYAGSNSIVILEFIYSDVCGPILVDSIRCNKYFVTFIDGFSRKLST